MSGLVLEARGLTVEYVSRRGNTVLVENSSFEVRSGQCLGILGESGSGKSMTVKAILGLLDRQFRVSGSAFFMGRDLLCESGESLRKLRGKEITMVLQNPMTCFDPLYRIGAQMAETFAAHTDWSGGEIRAKSLEILEKMHISQPEEALEKYPHQLSGGMLQRIMIGLALALHPKLLIADEPTTAIDAVTQREILDAFLRIRRKYDTAMIFITHDLGAAARVADEILVMNGGRIVDRGDFAHIAEQAAAPYTRLLVSRRAAVMERYARALKMEGAA